MFWLKKTYKKHQITKFLCSTEPPGNPPHTRCHRRWCPSSRRWRWCRHTAPVWSPRACWNASRTCGPCTPCSCSWIWVWLWLGCYCYILLLLLLLLITVAVTVAVAVAVAVVVVVVVVADANEKARMQSRHRSVSVLGFHTMSPAFTLPL